MSFGMFLWLQQFPDFVTALLMTVSQCVYKQSERSVYRKVDLVGARASSLDTGLSPRACRLTARCLGSL